MIFRRFVWNYFRLENEHLNNCGNFRAVRDISVAPLDTSDQALIVRMMDESDGVVHRRKRRPAKKKDETTLYLLHEETSQSATNPPHTWGLIYILDAGYHSLFPLRVTQTFSQTKRHFRDFGLQHFNAVRALDLPLLYFVLENLCDNGLCCLTCHRHQYFTVIGMWYEIWVLA